MVIKYTWSGLLYAHGCTRFNEAFFFCSLLDEQPPQQDLQKPQESEAADLLIEDVQAPMCQMWEANSTPNKRNRAQICSFWFTRSVALATRQRRRRSWCSLSHTVIACPGNVKCSFVHLTGSHSDWRTFNRIPERSKIPQGAVIKFLQALFEILRPHGLVFRWCTAMTLEEFASLRRLRISQASQRLALLFPHPIFISFRPLLEVCLAFWSLPTAISASFSSSSVVSF